jgi:hypothetical protein
MTPTRREYCWKCRGMVTALETGADDAYKCPICGNLTRDPREGTDESKRKVAPVTTVKPAVRWHAPAAAVAQVMRECAAWQA